VLGFLVVAAMGTALVFLLRSMNKQFRKIEPKADGTTGSQPGQNDTSAREAPK
jgi:hypothetical protein